MNDAHRTASLLAHLPTAIRERLYRLLCPPSPTTKPAISFLPQQIAITLRHDRTLEPPSAADQTAAALNRLLIEENERHIIQIARDRITSFDTDGPALALAFADIPTIESNDHLLRLIEILNRRISAQPNTGPITLIETTPNWLANSAGDYGSVGGPGTHPVPANAASATRNARDSTNPWNFKTPQHLELPPRTQSGAGVDIVILDTAPDRNDLDAALLRFPDHPILTSLLQPDVLRIAPGGHTHLLQITDSHLLKHPYLMIDHGPFIAGIIHTLAPQAHLHLIEVLNPYGVGTLETLARGLQQALQLKQQHPDRKLIVNCSLMLAIPPAQLITRFAQNDPTLRNVSAGQLERWSGGLKHICELLDQHNIAIVAAAGNDHETTDAAIPQARYPAAFHTVIGVGALESATTPASYSNLSDTPIRAGIATFGGKANGPLADAKTGILGLYTSTFPNGTPNTFGWARWAGTSFAAPIISGVLATLVSTGKTHPEAIAALRSVITQTSPIGDIFDARQGT